MTSTVTYEKNKSARVNVTQDEFEAVKNKLMELASQPGGVTAEKILQEAERPGSILHKYFDWNDSSAAYKYRLHQARQLMATVKVRVEGNHEPVVTRAIVHLQTDQSYQAVQNVMSDEEAREQLLQQALEEHIRWEKKWGYLNELSDLFIAGEVRANLFRTPRQRRRR